MKRNLAVAAAFMTGICCFSGAIAGAAAGQENSWEEGGESQVGNGSQEKDMGLQTENGKQEENPAERLENEIQKGSIADREEKQGENLAGWLENEIQEDKIAGLPEYADLGEKDISASERCSLQIPQMLAIVIDPWETDGKEQIYSEQYVIRNTGDVKGILTLSFSCRPSDSGSAAVRADRLGLHEGEEKSIYLEMVFGDGTRVVLLQEGSEYETVMEAGAELTVSFSGEVNENASLPWKDGDVEIEGTYSWSVVEDIQTDGKDREGESDDSENGIEKPEEQGEKPFEQESAAGDGDGQAVSAGDGSGQENSAGDNGIQDPEKDVPIGETEPEGKEGTGEGDENTFREPDTAPWPGKENPGGQEE